MGGSTRRGIGALLIAAALSLPSYSGSAGDLAALAPSTRAYSRSDGGAVDLALVLVTDVSRSIDEEEFEQQRQGYAKALTDPRVTAAFRGGANGAIVVSYVEFSGSSQITLMLDWAVLRDETTARAFATALLAAPRSSSGFTSISAGIEFATALLTTSGGAGEGAARRVIDVSGDGTNNSGHPVTDARNQAVAAGITINGLAIINNKPRGDAPMYHVQPPGGLPEYYRRNVIGGPGAFVLQVTGFDSFAESMTQKLTSEIAGLLPGGRQLAYGPLHGSEGSAR